MARPRPRAGRLDLSVFEKARFLADPLFVGRHLVFAEIRIGGDKKRAYIGNLWQRDPGGRLRKLTHQTQGIAHHPQHQPGPGRWLLFLSNRQDAKEPQVWLLPLDRGEPRPLTRVKGGVSQPLWAPHGKGVFFLADPRKVRGKEEETPDVQVIRRLFYKLNGLGFIHDRNRQIFYQPLRGKRPRQITRGTEPVENFTVTPDGRWILFTARWFPEADYTWRTDLYRVPAEGRDPEVILEFPGFIGSLAPSPDGRFLAFEGTDLQRGFSTHPGVWLLDLETLELRNLTRPFGLYVGNALNADFRWATSLPSLQWDENGRVYFVVTDQVTTHLMRMHPEGEPEVLDQENWCIDGFAVGRGPDPEIAVIASRMDHPQEIYRLQPGRAQALTRINRWALQYRFRPARHFQVPASDGTRIDAFYLPPRRRRRGAPPAILEIHGGPRTAYGHSFMLEFHYLAEAGFAVIFANPRGSAGYPEDFTDGVTRAYGERDYQDLMEVVDYFVAQGLADPERLGVTGGSYGGFMTNWIVGHTRRFRAAVTQRSISNFVSFYGTSDIGWRFSEHEIGGTPWQNLTTYWHRSPLAYVENIQTPLLILHAEEDLRCPMEQAEQLFVALKVLKREVELVRYPGENHELSRSGRPDHRQDRLRRIRGWFERYLLRKP